MYEFTEHLCDRYILVGIYFPVIHFSVIVDDRKMKDRKISAKYLA